MPNFDRLQRSRLKVTLLICGILVAFTFFPMWFIVYAATTAGEFHAAEAWASWGVAIAGIGSMAAYYVKKDSDRPSFVNNTVSNIHVPERKILDGEDKDDSDEIPL